MINKQQLINFLESHLGVYQLAKDDTQLKFYCPFCNHYKPKLEICIDVDSNKFGWWDCWVCGQSKGSRGKTITSLFKKLNADNTVLTQLYTIVGSTYKIDITKKDKPLFKENNCTDIDDLFGDTVSTKNVTFTNIKLPDEFKPLWVECKGLNPEYKNAKHYLKKRGVTESDIKRYKIGYCYEGLYAGMIIIPSYDKNNQLNFYYGRAYYDDAIIKHKLPELSKNFVGFENTINWSMPITIVEGGFDAIAVKRNVIPLFGKLISDELKKQIVINKVKEIYIALDNDALFDSIAYLEYFINNGITVYLVELYEKDPSIIGFKEFTRIKKESQQITQLDLLRLKAI